MFAPKSPNLNNVRQMFHAYGILVCLLSMPKYITGAYFIMCLQAFVNKSVNMTKHYTNFRGVLIFVDFMGRSQTMKNYFLRSFLPWELTFNE